jgi:acetate kinase
MSILAINAGTSTLKYALFDDSCRDERRRGVVEWDGGRASEAAETVSRLLSRELRGGEIRAVGHRVVHGGATFTESVRVDADVKRELERLGHLAPLHNPPALAAIEAAEAALPGATQAAVFDTAFFARLPLARTVYPLPYEWHEKWGVRRFGFHGISHAYCAGRAKELLGGRPAERIITCHLGNGCSAAAVHRGAAVATTMGFTPLEGLMMGTRSGSVDPGILLHVQRRCGLGAAELEEALLHRSGLVGVSGVSSDFRRVQDAADRGNERARLALEIYADRIRSSVGALAVALGGVDALVFTAGVGENAARLRAAVCEGLSCLGLAIDPEKNADCRPDADVAASSSPARILVIRTREEHAIAREAARWVSTT